MDVEDLLISGNNKRIFVNTAIGCTAQCRYCYLPDMGIEGVKYDIDLEDIMGDIQQREKAGDFIKGPEGTIVSFGCFTECLNKKSRDLTMEMLLFFLKKGNYIQLATKEVINEKDLAFLQKHLKYKNQITINVSLPVYCDAKEIEPNAQVVERRIQNFKLNNVYDIETVMYIKPVLENITFKSLDIYIKLIREYNLKVVIGKYLYLNKMENSTLQLVGSKEMWQKESDQCHELKEVLKKITKVYDNSTQIIEEYRRKIDEKRTKHNHC